MSKFEVILVEVKSIVIEAEAETSDKAVNIARQAASNDRMFDGRIGAVLCSSSREIEDDSDS